MADDWKKAKLEGVIKENPIVADCQSILAKYNFTADERDMSAEFITGILKNYRDQLGEGTEVRYRLRKRFGKIQLKMLIPGEKCNPFSGWAEDTRSSVERVLIPLMVNKTDYATHYYVQGTNIITATSPQIRKKAIKSPMVWAVLLGLVAGLLCLLLLPDSARDIILTDIAKPVQSVSIGIVTSTMGPLILFSMLVSVSALQSINELTNLGFRLIGRFILIILAVMVVGIAVMLLFYCNFGISGIDFRPKQIVELLLGIIPTNALSPLLNNNTPQLVVLGLVLGAALLLLGDRVSGLKSILSQINEWIMAAMGIVLKIVPVIPFISIFMVIAKGDGLSLLNGWEFIVASYVIAALCGGIKLVIVSMKYKVSMKVLWKKLWPMVSTAFSSANNSTMLKQEYEISKNALGIKPEFSSFWIPMSQAMLNPRITISLIIPPFLILKYTGQPISLSCLLIMILLVLELSIANPGTTGAWSILFAALAFPPEYVGTFLTYRLLTTNFNAGYGALQVGLEQIDAAAKADAIDLDCLREMPAA